MADILFTFEWWDYLSILLILIIGLPHGALDTAVGMSVGIYNSNKSKFIFLSSYLSMSILVVIFWYYYPQIALSLFLLISTFHFGLGDSKWNKKFTYYLSGYFNGGIIIYGLSYCNMSEVNAIYKVLVGVNSDAVWSFLEIGLLIWVISFPLHIYFNWKSFDKNYFLTSSFIIFIIYLLPPLLAFAIYFSLIHSINHIKRVIPALQKKLSKLSIMKLFFIFTIGSWLIGLIILFLLIQTNSITDAALKLTFIGLAALTFPHMILVDIFFRPKTQL
jgi:Brp/Blh family beta-carotene 15,15'-monooxygenase